MQIQYIGVMMTARKIPSISQSLLMITNSTPFKLK